MREKELQFGLLLDFYGELISDKRRNVLDLYYNNDYSLAEISEQIGITRQGVLDSIKKGKEELSFFEEKLNLAKRFEENEIAVQKIRAILSSEKTISDHARKEINAILLAFLN
ncbi:MAG: hypothetical protein E7601_08725 [Ruminococcaceae bacterium]|nr:hypothetical protein [Oscillospiraceae bacterium]MBO4971868.1 hypothetical protein [Clostridia bacterium]MBQ1258756.1 hypothetical protein [Clostridia bacterium]